MRTRLKERLAELTASVEPERLEQELALLLQRLDVDEELERLRGPHQRSAPRHWRRRARRPPARLPHAGAQPRSQHPVFEVPGSGDHLRSAVDMKVLIEQMREQVQNAE